MPTKISDGKCGETSKIKRPPLGLIPKKYYEEKIKIDRFNEICRAISAYYTENLKIPIEWIEEYNELVEFVSNYHNSQNKVSWKEMKKF